MAKGTLVEVHFSNGKSRGTIKPITGGQVDFFDFPGKLPIGGKVEFEAFSHKEMVGLNYGQQRPIAKALNGVSVGFPKRLSKLRKFG